MKEIERSVTIRAPREEVFAVIRDYGSYAAWMPGVAESRVLASEGVITVAEFLYRGEPDRRCVLEFLEKGSNRIQYGPSLGPDSPGISGELELKEGPSSECVTLVGRISEIHGRSLVSMMGTKRVVERSLEAALCAIRDRVLFRDLPEDVLLNWSDLNDEGVEKILRIVEDSKGNLRIWFLGRKYELRPLD